MASAKVKLPPELFDLLHLSALEHGGIGANFYYGGNADEPHCVIGHANDLQWNLGAPLRTALERQKFEPFRDNDPAVYRINKRRGESVMWARVPFEEWCLEAGVDVEDSPPSGTPDVR
jgi:hypothetical protein